MQRSTLITLSFILVLLSGCTLPGYVVIVEPLPESEVNLACFSDMDAGKPAYQCQTSRGSAFLVWEEAQIYMGAEGNDRVGLEVIKQWLATFCGVTPLWEAWGLPKQARAFLESPECIDKVYEAQQN